jgi:hypothetical protein
MNEHDVACQVRESFSGLRMDTPLEAVVARGRARRRHRLSAAAGAAVAATAAGATAALTLTPGGPATAQSGHPPVRLAAFSVTSGPHGSTTLTLRKGAPYRLDPAALRAALAAHGIPALVTVGEVCGSAPAPAASVGQVVHVSRRADGSVIMVIDGSAVPSGTRLSIGYFQGGTALGLIEDGAPLNCTSTPPAGNPAAPQPRPTGTATSGNW